MNLLATFASLALFAAPVLGGDMVEVWNTFQDEESTLGAEVRYEVRTVDIDDGLTLFPNNPAGTPEGGFYNISMDIDGDEGTVTWVLHDNEGAGHLVFEPGSYDRYYLIFPFEVKSASLVSSDNIKVETGVFGYRDDVTVDLFGNGLIFPEVIDNKCLYMFVKPETNLTELGQKIVVNIEIGYKKFSFMDWIDELLEAIGL